MQPKPQTFHLVNINLSSMHKQNQWDELVKACIRKDRKAQKKLYNLLSSRMFAVCLRYAANVHQAEDILQEGFIKVFQKLDTFRLEGSFEGWVRRIMINCALEEYRKSLKKAGDTQIDETFDVGMDNQIVEGINADEMLKCIQKLATGYRTVFNLYAIEGFSHQEIAEMLGISEATSKSQLSRARVLLQKMIKEMNQ